MQQIFKVFQKQNFYTTGGITQLARVFALQAKSYRFDSDCLQSLNDITQLAE